jgi:hypothetical protein
MVQTVNLAQLVKKVSLATGERLVQQDQRVLKAQLELAARFWISSFSMATSFQPWITSTP